jgi:hypothetical protein
MGRWLYRHRFTSLCLAVLTGLVLWSLALALACGVVILLARIIGRTVRRGLSPGWVAMLLLLCLVLRFFAIVALRYGYDMLYNQEYLQQLAVREIGKRIKPEFLPHLKPPRRIEISLWRKSVTVYDLTLPDTAGRTLLKIPKLQVVWQHLFPILRLASVTVDSPDIALEYDKRGRFNADIWRPSKTATALPSVLPTLRLQQCRATLNLPGINHMPWQWHATLDFVLWPNARRQYLIDGKIHDSLTRAMHFTGVYRPSQEGLFIYCQPFAFPVDGLSDAFVKKPWQLRGQLAVAKIVLTGASARQPEIHWDSHISFAQGSISCGEENFPLDKLEASVDVRGNNLCGIYAAAHLDEGKLSLENGRITPGGQLYLPFRITQFTPSSRMLPLLARATGLPLQDYWRTFQPHGTLDVDGLFMREAGSTWQGKASLQLKDGGAKYREIAISKMQLSVNCDRNGVSIAQGEWELQQGYFRIKPGSRLVWQQGEKLHADAELEFYRLEVNRALWAQLPEAEELWHALVPEGLVSGRARLYGNPLTDLPEIEVRAEKFTAAFYELPYPARNVTARFRLQNDCLHVLDVRGEAVHGGAPFQVFGKVWLREAPFAIAYDVYVQVRDVKVDQHLYQTFTSQEWHEDIRDIWHELDLHGGTVAVSARVHRPRQSPYPPTFHVRVSANNVAASYREFPYAVEDVRGEVVATPGRILLSRFKARKGAGKIEIAGQLIPQRQGIKADIEVNGYGLALDKDLRNTLPAEYQKVWDDFAPKGKLDIKVVARKERRGEPLVWQAVAQLYEAAGCYREFPYPVDHIEGSIILSPNRFIIHKLQGRQQDAQVRVDGSIVGERLDLRIRGRAVPVDETLRRALPAEVRAIAENFSVHGKVDGDIVLRRSRDKEPGQKNVRPAALEWQAEMALRDLTGSYLPFPYELEHISGRVSLSPSGFSLRECSGVSEGGKVSIECEQQREQPFSLYIRGRDVALDQKLYRALGENERQIWQMLSPEGRLDVAFAMRGAPESSYRLHLLPRDCTITYNKFPYRLSHIGAELGDPSEAGLVVTPGRVVLRGIQSKQGDTSLTLDGNWYHLTESGERRLSLDIAAQRLAVDDNFIKALTPRFPKVAKSLANTGEVADVRLRMQFYEGDSDYIQYDIAAKGAHIPFKKGGFFQEAGGDIELRGMAYAGNHHAEGRIDNGEVMCHDLRLSHISTPCKLFNDYLLLSPLRANFYDGEVQGWLNWDTSGYSAYQGFFSVSGAQLSGIAQALSSGSEETKAGTVADAKTRMQGLLRTEISFQGNAYGSEFLVGKGWLQVEKGEILQLPILLAIFDLLSLPDRPAFREGEVIFTLAKRLCEISSLRLHSSLLSISGTGNISFDGKLNLRLLTHLAPRYIPRIPIVDQIWDTLKKEFFEVSVTGTIKEPSLSLSQLQNLGK